MKLALLPLQQIQVSHGFVQCLVVGSAAVGLRAATECPGNPLSGRRLEQNEETSNCPPVSSRRLCSGSNHSLVPLVSSPSFSHQNSSLVSPGAPPCLGL